MILCRFGTGVVMPHGAVSVSWTRRLTFWTKKYLVSFHLFHHTIYSFGPKPCIGACTIVYTCQQSQILWIVVIILWFNTFSGWCFTARCDRSSSLMFSLQSVNRSCHLDWSSRKRTLPEFPWRFTHEFNSCSRCITYLKSELDRTLIFSVRRLLESAPTL